MMADGRIYLQSAPWLLVGPGIVLTITAFGVSLIGEALKDRTAWLTSRPRRSSRATEPLPEIVVEPGVPYLDVDHLRIGLMRDGAPLRIVDSATFALQPGASLGIVGESGSGKTMLCRSFTGTLTALRRRTSWAASSRSPATT